MALNTNIVTPAAPAAPVAPTVNSYSVPDTITATQPTGFDAANTGYTTPAGANDFTVNNLNQGLLEYDPTNSSKLTFDGRDINASNIGANVNNVTPDFKTADQFLTNGAFVENRVNNLMSQDNELNQRMRAQGQQQAAGMGLANSTMAATIGQANMIDKATQIATPDATTQATADMSRQSATYQAQRANQDAQNQGSLAEQTAKINAELNKQNAGSAWDAKGHEAALQADINKLNANIAGAQTTQNAQYNAQANVQAGLLEGAKATQQGAINAELAQMESMSAQNLSILQAKLEAAGNTTAAENQAIMSAFTAQQELIKTNLTGAYNAAINQAQIDSEQKQVLASNMASIAKDYEISIQNILLDPNLTAAAKNSAIAKVNLIFDQDMANIAAIFGATYNPTTT